VDVYALKQNKNMYSYKPAMNRDRSLLTKLFLSFVNLSYEVNETLPRFGYTLFWPICELELTNSS